MELLHIHMLLYITIYLLYKVNKRVDLCCVVAVIC